MDRILPSGNSQYKIQGKQVKGEISRGEDWVDVSEEVTRPRMQQANELGSSMDVRVERRGNTKVRGQDLLGGLEE